MAKKTSLQAALSQVSGKNTEPKKIASKIKPKANSEVNLAPSRQGKKSITGYFDPAVSQQLKILSAERDMTIQALLAESLNDLFEKYRKKPIA